MRVKYQGRFRRREVIPVAVKFSKAASKPAEPYYFEMYSHRNHLRMSDQRSMTPNYILRQISIVSAEPYPSLCGSVTCT